MPMWSDRVRGLGADGPGAENRIDTDLDRLSVIDPNPLQGDLPDSTLTRIAECGEAVRERALTR